MEVLVFFLFVVLANILIFLFWGWMFIDCLRREEFPDKIVWVIVLLFTYLLGAILYLIMVKGKPPKLDIGKAFIKAGFKKCQ
jgi:uncharacterized membrane protein YphA (DoxX/SURF4 family)